jgi:hypothetical protein
MMGAVLTLGLPAPRSRAKLNQESAWEEVMSFDVSVAGIGIPTDSSALKSFRDELNLAFGLDKTLASFLDGPMAGVPSSATTSHVSYTSSNASWAPGGGPVTFGLSGGVSGRFEIVLTGDLVPYTDGLDNPKQTSIPVPPHTACTRLTLNFSINANVSGSGNFSGGPYGVKGSASSTDVYAITFCKTFDPSTSVKTAIGLTFQGFVLPLNPDTLALLSSGDYLLHEFDGNLNLSFGAFAGIDQVLYSGQSSADVLSVNGSPLATLSVQAKPEIKADVELDFTFQYATTFEALVSKVGTIGKLHLFRSSKADATTSLMAGLTFKGNASAEIVAGSLAKSTGGGSSVVRQVATAASTEIDKGVSDVNNALSNWLNPSGPTANLQVAIESICGRTVIAAYDFDVSDAKAPGLKDAWNFAVNGDLVKALAHKDPAGKSFVTLEVGSGLENEYQRKTSFSCNFFNLWKFSDWNQWKSQVSMVYAGNNVFHMNANIGRMTETDAVGTMKSINFYFTASADEAIDGSISKAAVDLHVVLTAHDATSARQIAGMLSAIGGSPECITMARNMNAFVDAVPKGTVQLNITIPSRAYSYIAADPVSHSKVPANTVHDKKNWDTFAQTADDLNAWPLRQMSGVSSTSLSYVKSYQGWEDLNQAFNGFTVADRSFFGNSDNWPPDLNQITDTGTRQIIAYSVKAGQSFMNLCDCLQQLVSIVDVKGTGVMWSALVDLITKAAKDYVADFARPVALSLIWLCGSGIMSISGPPDSDSSKGAFNVKLSM